MTDNEESSRDYYYDREATEKLGIAESDLWRMKLPRSLDEGRGGFPKQTVDSIVCSWSEVLCSEYEEAYYRLDRFAEAIKRNPDRLVDKPTIFYEQP